MKLSSLISPVPGSGTPASPRNSPDGRAGPEFGSLLGGLAKDAPAATPPAVASSTLPVMEARGSAGALVPGSEDNGEAGSRQPSSSWVEGDTQLSDVAAATALPVAGIERAPGASGMSSLLTLATQAAGTARGGATAAPATSDADVVATITLGPKDQGLRFSRSSSDLSADGGVQAGGRVGRKAPKPDGDDRAGTVAAVMAPTPAAGLVAAFGALVPAPGSGAADAIQTDALEPARASAPEIDHRAMPPAAGIADDAFGLSPALAPTAAPAIAAGEIEIASVLPVTTSPVDAAILPGSVRLESHLGFDRGVPDGVAQVSRDIAAGGAEGQVAVPKRSNAQDGSSSDNFEPFVEPSTAAPQTDGGQVVSSGAAQSRLASVEAVSPSPDAKRLETYAPLGSADNKAVTEAPSRAASADVAPSDEVGRLVSPMTKAAVDDEPKPPTAMDPVPGAPIAAVAMPNPSATPPVAQQVADGVVGLASTVVPDVPGPATPVAPARTMALQLSPAGLGTLTVRLHVSGRALDVHLEASDGRTATLIDRDRDALSGALRGKDYQLQSLSVTTRDATMPGGTHAEQGTDSRSADRGSPGPFRDEPSGGRSGDGGSREAPGREARPSRRPVDEAAVERGGSSLFV